MAGSRKHWIWYRTERGEEEKIKGEDKKLRARM